MIRKPILSGLIVAAFCVGVYSGSGGGLPLPGAALCPPLPLEGGAGDADRPRTFNILLRTNDTKASNGCASRASRPMPHKGGKP
jgi:hypothetical protein